MSSALCFQPSTPTSHRHDFASYSNLPINSSPLASSSPPQKSSPVSAAQARRRDQYKQVVSSPTNLRRKPTTQARNTSGSSRLLQPASDSYNQEAPRKTVLRERFKARCLERAHKDRARKVSGRRGLSSDSSSDGVDADMDVEEDEETEELLNDEVCLVKIGRAHV